MAGMAPGGADSGGADSAAHALGFWRGWPSVATMAVASHRNNFTLVRLALASAVIWTHCYWLIFGRSGADQFSGLFGVPISAMAVDGFFFLSGFLVYASLARRGNALSFIIARLARVWPGLAVATIITMLAGLAFTRSSMGEYFSGATLRFLSYNLSLLTTGYTLTGVRCTMPGGVGECVINGSLWTIVWEVRFYLLLALLAVVRLSSERAMRWFILPATALFTLAWHMQIVDDALKPHLPHAITYNLAIVDRLWLMFALGIAAYVWRGRVRLSWLLCLALLAGAIAARGTGAEMHVRSLFVAYAVLCCGLLSAQRGRFTPGPIAAGWPDYSYGTYIYAFPVMMALHASGLFTGQAALAAATLAGTIPLAALSWHLVERPAMDWARRRFTRPDPVSKV